MVLRLLSLISGGYIIQSESTGGHQAQKRKSVVNPVEKDEDRAYSTADGVHVGVFFFFPEYVRFKLGDYCHNSLYVFFCLRKY